MSTKDSQIPQATPRPKKASSPKIRISFTAVKAIITGLLLAGLIIVILLIYYPNIFPWNW